MGKVKIAQMLCRAGLHLGKTTVERILKEEPIAPPTQATENANSEEEESPERIVIANYPNHVWGLDLTAVPLFGGLWTSWASNALPQCWPFCWWLALVVDHKSRRAMGSMIFRKPPSSRAVQEFLERMAILLLRAAHGWSLKQTAKRFLVTSATIASWVKRLDEQGPKALVQLWEPVNKFPDFVRYAVQSHDPEERRQAKVHHHRQG